MLAFVVFVVSLELLRSLYSFSVKGMSYEVFNRNDNRLIHFVADDHADLLSFFCFFQLPYYILLSVMPEPLQVPFL